MTARPVTVVTGGGRGIGAAVVRRLVGEGHHVVLGYRADRQAAEETLAGLGDGADRCRALQVDVTDAAQVEAFLAEACALFGTPTGLVNNAGATMHLGDLADTPVEVLRAVVEVNLVGALLCARAAVRVMGRSRGGAGGVIVNVSSAAATLGAPHEYVHYAAAKAGVDALTVGLAKEVAADGVRVTGVAPGSVHTRIHADAGDPGRAARLAAAIPLGRSAQPEEVAGVVAFLLGEDAAYLTGATVRMAGGR